MELARVARKGEVPDRGPMFTTTAMATTERTRDSAGDDEAEPTTAILLETAAGTCKQLAERLRRNGHSASNNPNYKGRVNGATENYFPSSTLISEEKKKYYSALIEENIRLRATNQDILESNKRWQMLNDQRDDYINKLIRTIRDLQKQNDGRFSPTPNSQSWDYENVKQFNVRLAEDSRLKTQESEELRRKIAHLMQQIEIQKASHSEHVNVLEMQIRAHHDDWEGEKNEKIEIQHREAQLIEEVQQMKILLRESREQLRQMNMCRCSCRRTVTNPSSYSEPIIRDSPYVITAHSSTQLISRTPNRFHDTHLVAEIVPDGPITNGPSAGQSSSTSPPSPGRTIISSFNPGSSKDNSFQCPNCNKTFPQQLHVQYLEHFEQCQRKSRLEQ